MRVFNLVIVVNLVHMAAAVLLGNMLMRASSTVSKEMILVRSTTYLLLRVRVTMASVTSMTIVYLLAGRIVCGVRHVRAIAVRLVRRRSIGVSTHVIVERHL